MSPRLGTSGRRCRGPVLPSTAHSSCCCSVNADPKVSIKDAVGRVATATPRQALASPGDLWKQPTLWVTLLDVPRKTADDSQDFGAWRVLREAAWDGDLMVGSEGPRPLDCDQGDLECRMSQALSVVCRAGEQDPQTLLGYLRRQGLCARGLGLGSVLPAQLQTPSPFCPQPECLY